jgi:hypothetical protein
VNSTSTIPEISLKGLADQINAEHALCMAAAQDAVNKAIEVGRLLAEAKDQVRHGEWAGWVAENCSFGLRQSQKYMKAYGHREQILEQMRTEGAHLSLNGAMAQLARPKAPQAEAVTDNCLLQESDGIAEERPSSANPEASSFIDALENDKALKFGDALFEGIKAYRAANPHLTDDDIRDGMDWVFTFLDWDAEHEKSGQEGSS